MRQARPISRLGSGAREAQQTDVAAVVHLARHRHLRQQRDAIAMGDHLHDGGEARRAEALARLWGHQTAKGERLVAQAMAFLQQQKPLMGEHVGGGRSGALAPGGARREDELVVEQMEGLGLRILDRKRDQDQVEIAAHELPHQSLGDGLAELQGELGEAPLQLGQRRRQQIGRDRRDRPELQRPRQHPLPMLRVIKQIAHRGKDSPPAPDDLLPLLGQLDRPTSASLRD